MRFCKIEIVRPDLYGVPCKQLERTLSPFSTMITLKENTLSSLFWQNARLLSRFMQKFNERIVNFTSIKRNSFSLFHKLSPMLEITTVWLRHFHVEIFVKFSIQRHHNKHDEFQQNQILHISESKTKILLVQKQVWML